MPPRMFGLRLLHSFDPSRMTTMPEASASQKGATTPTTTQDDAALPLYGFHTRVSTCGFHRTSSERSSALRRTLRFGPARADLWAAHERAEPAHRFSRRRARLVTPAPGNDNAACSIKT